MNVEKLVDKIIKELDNKDYNGIVNELIEGDENKAQLLIKCYILMEYLIGGKERLIELKKEISEIKKELGNLHKKIQLLDSKL